jgi:hypothetical protein
MQDFLRVDPDQDTQLIGSLITAARRWCENYTQRRFLFTTVRLLMDFFPGYVDFKLTGQRVSSPFVSGSNAVLVGIRYAIALPYPIVSRIVKFQYQDQNGDPVVMVVGTDFIQDLSSQPARLMPLFGQMWPVARVTANAVIVDYVSGYGGNITVNTTAGSPVITGYTFAQTDVGSTISIPGAGVTNLSVPKPFVSTILSVAENGNATLVDNAVTGVENATAYLGQKVPAEIDIAIKLLVAQWYENRVPSDTDIPFAVKALLMPYRDLRL